MPGNRPVVETDAQHVRNLFNEHWLPLLETGQVRQTLLKDRHPSRPRAAEPFCTRSQFVRYIAVVGDRLTEVARAHQYLRTDGSIGASGRPDPKQVLHEGKIYIVAESAG